MTESAVSSPGCRSTSLTMRQRLTPASACSTRTRMRPSWRFVRFCAAVNSPPRGFFFRLVCFRHRRLVLLEAAVLVQCGAVWVGDPFPIGDPFVRNPYGVGPALVLEYIAD